MQTENMSWKDLKSYCRIQKIDATLKYKVLFMKANRDYVSDLADIRAMMERSTKFLSLSGWSGVLAGTYALIGVYIAHSLFGFEPVSIEGGMTGAETQNLMNVLILAILILVLSITTSIVLSHRRAVKMEEPIWNSTSRRLLSNITTPLLCGGVLMIIFVFHGLIGLLAPISLIFYGLALYTAGNYTYREVRYLGLIQIVLGLISCCCIACSMSLWAVGFGLMHIVYGIYIHLKYER